jgi:catechol 2,3-dioxygenase-like lactoylglutathione lyase family enzyme
LDASVAFYERWAGMKLVVQDQSTGITAARLTSPRQAFVLSLFVSPTAASLTGLAHLGMELETKADIDKLAADAKAAGVLIFGPADSGSDLGYQAFLVDPDGNNVEFSAGQRVGVVPAAAAKKK